MSVVINDFEVVTEPERPAPEGEAQAEDGAASRPLSPREVEQALRVMRERAARVAAH
jgi:hypothetical protein